MRAQVLVVVVLALVLSSSLVVGTDKGGKKKTEKKHETKTETKPKSKLPSSGTKQLAPGITAEYSAARVVYGIGNPQAGNPIDSPTFQRLSFPISIYRNAWGGNLNTEHISDIQVGDGSRITNQGGEHMYIASSRGKPFHHVSVCMTAEYKAIKCIEFVFGTMGHAGKHDFEPHRYCGRSRLSCSWFTLPEPGAQRGELLLDGFKIMKANSIIDYMTIEFTRPVPNIPAQCSKGKVVAVVENAVTGLVLTESREDFEGTSIVRSESHTLQASTAGTVTTETTVPVGVIPVTVGVSVTTSLGYEFSKSKEEGSEKGKTKGSELTIDLTNRVMVSYFLMLPCEYTMPGDDEKTKTLSPYDSRMRRLLLPVETCLTTIESDTTDDTTKHPTAVDNVNIEKNLDGSVDLSVGSCILPQKFQWLDRSNLLEDVGHLIDIKGSKVVKNIDELVVTDPVKAIVYANDDTTA